MAEGASRRTERVRAADGTELEVRMFLQDEPRRGSAPVVLCAPAMGVAATYYDPFALELHERGLNVVTYDLRGHGSSSVRAERGVRFGYYDMITLDWAAAVRATRAIFPDNPLFLLGHSLGGQLSSLYVSLHGEEVRGLVLIAACSVYYRGYGLVGGAKVLLGTQFAAVVAKLLGYFPGRRLRFAGDEAADVMFDWARQARTGRYDLARSVHDFERLLAAVQHPILAISVEGDSLAPPGAVDHLCQKMPLASVERWHYTRAEATGTAGAAGVRLDHFRWVRHSGPVADRVATWIETIVR